MAEGEEGGDAAAGCEAIHRSALKAGLSEDGLFGGVLEAAHKHGGYARAIDEHPVVDGDGKQVCHGAPLRAYLNAIGVFRDYKIPESITVDQLADALADAHTQFALFELYQAFLPAILAAVAAGPGRKRGILIDATPTRIPSKKHPDLPFKRL